MPPSGFTPLVRISVPWYTARIHGLDGSGVMRLTFKLRFHTAPGDSLWLVGDHEIFGGNDLAKAIPLHYVDANFWQVTLVLPRRMAPDAEITYHYLWRQANGSFSEDWGVGRSVNPARVEREEWVVVDSWNHPGFFENAFYTEPFQSVLLRRPEPTAAVAQTPARATHLFRVKAPLLAQTEIVCLLGSCSKLASWNTHQPVLLNRRANEDYFTGELDLAGEPFPIDYKYGVYDLERQSFIRYEDGPNRFLAEAPAEHRTVVVNDGFVVLPADTWHGAGVSIPVFSLRSEAGFGVGEFLDLKALVDWCQRVGLKMIQLLPINDTTATYTSADSYPYSAISAFALHPIYLHLPAVVEPKNRRLLEPLERQRQRVNGLPELDYESVIQAKIEVLKQIYALQREKTFERANYGAFFSAHEQWLVPYAFFCCLRDRYHTANFTEWPEHRRFHPKELEAELRQSAGLKDEMGFHYFLQFHLHLQLREVVDYAHANGIILKGDIPIGVFRYGVDAWQEPELYRMELQAGAPPDPFAEKGQNWSFPTYNWPRMAETGFAWWKSRLRQMSNYFDAFRIDHILGFFRIWSIPIDAVEGILGFFDPALPVGPEDFERRGIPFERERFLQPYITEELLRESFGDEWRGIRDRFLTPTGPETFALKPEFVTQRQVEAFFSTVEANEQNERIKIGLYDLISNVILLQPWPDGSNAFHFRLRMDATYSFKSLSPGVRSKLKDLYLDYFFRRQEEFWRVRGFERLPAIKQVTNMLICGEDLGMVPKCVPNVMKQLGILGLEVQRMPKSSKESFSSPSRAAYLSVVTPSTHDMSTIRGWWGEDRAITQKFFNQELGQFGNAPETCEPWINKAIVGQHLASPAMWSVFQLQDLLGIDERLRFADPQAERINIPADPKHYWRYRVHLTMEELLGAEGFISELRTCIEQAGRT
jgi:4-alpha-glucanotransferase